MQSQLITCDIDLGCSEHGQRVKLYRIYSVTLVLTHCVSELQQISNVGISMTTNHVIDKLSRNQPNCEDVTPWLGVAPPASVPVNGEDGPWNLNAP